MDDDARRTRRHDEIRITDPPVARFLFQGTTASWVWLVVRLWAGWNWLSSGLGKFQDPAWMDGSGRAISGFWQRAVAIPEPPARPLITYDWYREFLQLLINTNSAGWFSYVIVFGELAVGIGLMLGAFTGIAAAGGLMMNTAFLLAGTTSTNPVMGAASILLLLAWKNAGWVGLDRWLLPALGTPWQPVRRTAAEPEPAPMQRAA